MKVTRPYTNHTRYLLCSKVVGRNVGNKVEIIKNKYSKSFEVITKEEFLQYKDEEDFIINEGDISYIISKEYETIFAIRKLQGKL